MGKYKVQVKVELVECSDEAEEPDKEFCMTGDICDLLDMHPDTFRYRLRSGIYPEAKNRSGDKRRFSHEEVVEIVWITNTMPRPKYKPRGK